MPKLKTRAVAGAANNQLRTPAVGQMLQSRDIWYAPDYVINGGGLINVAAEYAGYDRAKATQKTLEIYDTIANIIDRARREQAQPERSADQLAQEIIASGGHKK